VRPTESCAKDGVLRPMIANAKRKNFILRFYLGFSGKKNFARKIIRTLVGKILGSG
jgi:hypothetical protein